tara:strand:+ start:195 stop:629 length:435 start_codon:yes stop_codon:yes gene_type:complete
LIVTITDNVSDIRAVLCNPAIYDTITDDNSPNIEDFKPPINDKYLYVGGYVDNEIIGLMVYHKYLDGNECHMQVLPEHRKDHAKEFGEQSLKHRGTQPLYAEIPDLYKNVLDFALLNDFKVIKRIDSGFIKNGVNHTVNVLRYK